MAKAKTARISPKTQAEIVVRELAALYPDSHCALKHENPYQLLVATILSAQCTDARVNMVTPDLFARYPDPPALAKADSDELEGLIHSAGFFRAKAKNLKAMAEIVTRLHGGEIPTSIETLTNLPGVGRKTANVVLGNAFNIASGVVVDTHVKRLGNRLGLTKSLDPVVIERELNAIVPSAEWVNLSHRLIDHGRKVCFARKPLCEVCPIANICPKIGVAIKSEAKPILKVQSRNTHE